MDAMNKPTSGELIQALLILLCLIIALVDDSIPAAICLFALIYDLKKKG
jgi:hypothetical protein